MYAASGKLWWGTIPWGLGDLDWSRSPALADVAEDEDDDDGTEESTEVDDPETA